jgi:hypothetical protein
MPRRAAPTPIKYCEWCGQRFARKRVGKARMLECVSGYLRRRYCSIPCSMLKKREGRRGGQIRGER